MMKLIDDVAKIRLLENCPGWRGKVSVTRVSIRVLSSSTSSASCISRCSGSNSSSISISCSSSSSSSSSSSNGSSSVCMFVEGLLVSTQRLGLDRQHDNHDGGEEE